MSTPLEDLLKRLEQLEREQTRLKANIDLIKDKAKKLQDESSDILSDEVSPPKEKSIEEELTPNSDLQTEELVQNVQKPFVYEPSLEEKKEPSKPTAEINESSKTVSSRVDTVQTSQTSKPAKDESLEKFLGENLTSKIGIGVLILGAAIFAKYAIDHNWITPFLRILFGYLVGGATYFLALRFKEKYLNLSAILMAGSLCIAYLISYFAFSLYEFYPRWLAFILLLIFTGHTVQMALNYKKEVIAIIALVGAYAVPFLLSNNSGKVEYLFTYIAIINIGTIFLSLRKRWMALWNGGFFFTWLIFMIWAITERFSNNYQDTIAIGFLVVFFGTFLVGLVRFAALEEGQKKRNYLFQLGFLSFVLFVFGNFILGEDGPWDRRILFSFLCSALYIILHLYLHKQNKYDRLFVDIILGVGVIFFTGFVAIAFDNEMKTAMWGVEALVLTFLGIKHDQTFLRRGSFYIGILALISTTVDTSQYYDSVFQAPDETPFFNKIFALNSFMILLLVFNSFVQGKKARVLVDGELNTKALTLIALVIAAFITPLIDLTFAIKQHSLSVQWNHQWYGAVMSTSVWSYAVVYVALSKYLINLKYPLPQIDKVYTGLISLLSVLFLLLVVPSYYFLVENKGLNTAISGVLNLNALSLIPLLILWLSGNRLKLIFDQLSDNFFTVAARIYLLVFLSMELMILLEVGFLEKQSKVAMSILWGAYALYQIVDGVRKKQKEFRWIGLVLLAVTLVKLFLLDLAKLSTISKTISLVALGIFLLLVSYLYNRFKDRFDWNDESGSN